MRLTRAQRDFLASYPDDVIVEVEGADEDAHPDFVQVRVVEGDIEEEVSNLMLPPEGFLGQPGIQMVEPEAALDRLPSALWTDDHQSEARERDLDALKDHATCTYEVFWALMHVGMHEGVEADWDCIVEKLRKGVEKGHADDEPERH